MAAEVDHRALEALKGQLPAILEEGRAGGHDVDKDPYLQLDQVHLCRRYLIATDGNIAEAAERIRATIAFRRDWQVLEYHRPGVAQQLFSEATNPGAEMYFAPSGHVDRLGRPYAVGRVNYANAANMHPWRHLRAGLCVIERMAVDVLRRGCGYGSYILDIGEVPTRGTVSGTGGTGHRANDTDNPYYRRGAGREAPACILKRFGEPKGGMAVLRVALTVANLYYPELMSRVVVLNSNWLFGAAFRVFSLWVHRRTREKFIFVGGGWTNPPVHKLLDWYAPEELPVEWGGTGWRLDGDSFIAAGIKVLDTDPALPPGDGGERGYAGVDERERGLAEEDAKARAAERGTTLSRGASQAVASSPGVKTRGGRGGAAKGAGSTRPRVEWSCCVPCLVRPRAQARRPPAPAALAAPAESGPRTSAQLESNVEAGEVSPSKSGLGARAPHHWKVVAALTMLFAATVLQCVMRAAGKPW